MRTFGIMALTLGAAFALTAPAQAQQGQRGRGFGFGFGRGGYALVGNKSVQQEIKLEGEQAEKVAKLVADINAKAREKLQDIPQDERREKGAEVFRAANEEAKAAVKSELKPEQFTRLEQIVRQQEGLRAFATPATAEKLNLTADQKAKIREIGEEAREKSQGLFEPGGDRQAAMEKIRAIQKESLEKAVSSLTDEQKKTWKELTGEPFEVKYEFERRRDN